MPEEFNLLDKFFMQEAFKQAQQAFKEDEVPIGCVITFQNKIIAKSYNQVERLKDPTAHAEMIAITQAANSLSQKWLHECNMYVTIEPCSMCAGGLVLSRLKTVYFGAYDPKTGACGSVFNIAQSEILNHRISVIPGLMQEECSSIITEYFKGKRTENKKRFDLN